MADPCCDCCENPCEIKDCECCSNSEKTATDCSKDCCAEKATKKADCCDCCESPCTKTDCDCCNGSGSKCEKDCCGNI